MLLLFILLFIRLFIIPLILRFREKRFREPKILCLLLLLCCRYRRIRPICTGKCTSLQ